MNERNELCCNHGESDAACVASVERVKPVRTYRPHYTSRYDHEAWEVAVRLPGAKKEDVSVTVENEILEISAFRRLETPEGWRPLGHHESEKRWQLRLDVGPEVDESRISGKLADGVLTLRLPLREELKPRNIEIS